MVSTQNVSIIGGGDMGHGFAVHFTRTDKNVTLVDHRESNLVEARENIREVVEFLREQGITELDSDAVVEDIEFTLNQDTGVKNADLVLETVSEDLSVKQSVFEDIAESAPLDAILASNTSGIPITDIAKAVPDAAERVVGCHWWYPPYLLPTVEIVRGEETSDQTVELLSTFLKSIDRVPIRVNRDVPGFVWNRLQYAVYREALYLVEEDVAPIEDINRAIRDGWAIRTAAIGPFETMDIAGLELVRTVGEEVFPALCDADEPSPLFDELIETGRGGIHDGAGFLKYDALPEEITRTRDEKVAAIRQALEDE